jgi:hypothetical protein
MAPHSNRLKGVPSVVSVSSFSGKPKSRMPVCGLTPGTAVGRIDPEDSTVHFVRGRSHHRMPVDVSALYVRYRPP